MYRDNRRRSMIRGFCELLRRVHLFIAVNRCTRELRQVVEISIYVWRMCRQRICVYHQQQIVCAAWAIGLVGRKKVLN